MTAQRGQVWKKKPGVWAIRWYAADGRHQRSGFKTKTEAQAVLDHELKRRRMGVASDGSETLNELVRQFFAQYDKSPSRVEVMRWAVGKAQERFGQTRLDRLTVQDLGAWRLSLPERQRFQVFAALRQVLAQGVVWKMLADNPARHVKNEQPRGEEVAFFSGWDELALVCEEIGEWATLVVFAAGTGLRPEEWAALERRDLSLPDRVVTVRRVVVKGVVSTIPKTTRSRRRVPLRQIVCDALSARPARIDSKLVFPSVRGGHVSLHNWRERHWNPAVEAAGLERRTPYSLRHSYAAWSIAAGVDLFTLSRRMGTSMEMLDRTYGHLLPQGEAGERFLLDDWDAGRTPRRESRTGGRGVGTSDDED